jgi:hypothetical protein
MRIIPTEIHDKDGNLVKIEYHDEQGKFVIQAVWDEMDEQTAENRDAFRKWATRLLAAKDYTVVS